MKKICPICKAEYLGGEVFCAIDAARLITPSQVNMDLDGNDDPLVGAELDRYRVIRRVGEGGMGLVYEALHLGIEKVVAIKVLRDDFSSRPEVVARFRQEAKSASRIGHENIVDISDFGSTPSGQSYFVMEYLEGEDLADLLSRETTLPSARVIPIVIQCSRALSAAHSKGIVHRDMKPENIFLTKRGDNKDFVKIVDFGIAKMSDIETAGAPGRKLTKTGMIFGTPEYMSPEQAAGKGLDHRVDIYAMGVIMYELVTGRVPFVGDTFMGVLTQHMFETAPDIRELNPHVECSRELEMVIHKCLSKDANDRYASMDELTEALLDAKLGKVSEVTLAGYGDPVKAKARPPRAPRSEPTLSNVVPAKSGSRVGLMLGAVVLLAAGAGGAVLLSNDGRGDTPPLDAGVSFDAAPADVGSLDAEPVDVGEAAEDVPELEDLPVAPAMVALTVETGQAGARVIVEGHPELVCESTPCTLQVPAGVEYSLSATRGRMRGEETVTPTSDQTIEVRLRGRGRPSTNGTNDNTGMGPSDMDLKKLPF